MASFSVPTDWTPPSDRTIGLARTMMGFWRWMTAPKFYGSEQVPRDRPVMFIGNHTLMGMLDTPLLLLGIYEQTGHYCRSMGDHFHFAVPGWRDLLMRFGVVDGTRDNCRSVMADGHSLLIFPGGGREVYKRRGEAYQLIWGKRTGFARLAIEYGYTVVPVSSVGAEDCYRVLLDQNDIAKTSVGKKLIERAPRSDVAFPTMVYGVGGTPLPIPQRFYFSFGTPIESSPYQGKDDASIFAFREEVRIALEALLEDLLAEREADPERRLAKRFLGARVREAPALAQA